ncbi:hypothetical protein JAAARDRAFT_438686 [Jaapia argillacea MUCL 33604]|uniref:Uncharacterized protein n=1 Tax=Jaapia argillacea MUCL 33604 TaxID=933084 RepID=A0A067PPK9_9AGAM|nr:hypothetical protein JAAARDRAFT_438686 [Jaapia argillacea MUCL 33604]
MKWSRQPIATHPPPARIPQWSSERCRRDFCLAAFRMTGVSMITVYLGLVTGLKNGEPRENCCLLRRCSLIIISAACKKLSL